MGEDKLQALFERLRKLKYRSDRWDLPVIREKSFDAVEAIIRQFFTENLAKENGEMQAKIYAYEQIIANSNFAPMLPKSKVGHWIDGVCSECGWDAGQDAFSEDANFCMKCGIKMEEQNGKD